MIIDIDIKIPVPSDSDIDYLKYHHIMYDIHNNMILKKFFNLDAAIDMLTNIDNAEFEDMKIVQKTNSEMLWLLDSIILEVYKRFDPSSNFRRWYRNVTEIEKYTVANLNKMINIIETIRGIINNKIEEIDQSDVREKRYDEVMALIAKQKKSMADDLDKVIALKEILR